MKIVLGNMAIPDLSKDNFSLLTNQFSFFKSRPVWSRVCSPELIQIDAARNTILYMKHVAQFVMSSLVGGLLIVVPLYLSVLLIVKVMKTVGGLVRPFARLLPQWFP